MYTVFVKTLQQEGSILHLVLGITLETIAIFFQIEGEEKDALSFCIYWNPLEVIT